MVAVKYIFLSLLAFLLFACGQQSKEELFQAGLDQLTDGNARGSIIYFRNALEKDPNYFPARFHLADAYIQTGKLLKAEKELKKVARQNPDYPDLPIKFAKIYLRSDRPERVIALLDDFHATHQPSPESLDLLGRARSLLGDYAKAETAFRKALELSPVNDRVVVHLADALIKAGKSSPARQLLETVIRRSPKSRDAWVMLGDLELKDGHQQRALSVYRDYVSGGSATPSGIFRLGLLELQQAEHGRVAPLVAELEQRFPRDPRGVLLKGLLLYRDKNFEQAAVELQRFLSGREDPLATYFLGLCSYHLGQFEQALNQFQKVLDRAPRSSQARCMLAMTLLRQGRTDDALAQVKRSLVESPDDAWAYNVLSSIYFARGEYESGVEALDRVLEIDPGLAEAHLKKGFFMVAFGDESRGGQELVKAVEIDPDTVNSRLLLGQFYLNRENFSKARTVLEAGLKGRPQDALFFRALARVAFAMQDKVEGVALLKKAIAAHPEFSRPYLDLGRYYLSCRQYKNAEETLRRLLKIAPKHREGTMQLGLALELEGNEAGAVELYRSGVEAGWAESYVALALLRARHQDWAGGARLLAGAPVRDKKDLPGQSLLARFYLKMGQPESAFEVLAGMERIAQGSGYPQAISILLQMGEKKRALDLASQVVREHPDSPYGYILGSNIHLAQHNPEAAMEWISRGLKAIPGSLPLRTEAARCKEAKGQGSEALLEYKSILSDNPKYFPAQFAIASYYDQGGDKKAARSYYRKTLELAPKYTPALNNLAYILADNYNEIEEAFALVLRAYRNEPQNSAVLDTLGCILLKKGVAEEAIRVLEKALRASSGNKLIALHLAEAYRSVKDFDRAKGLLEKLANDQGFKGFKKARALLAQLETVR